MSTALEQSQLPPGLRRVLDDARRRLRAYVWLYGLAAVVVLAGAMFWGGMLLDWLFEPAPAVRRVALIGVAIAGVVVVYRYLFRRLVVRISDASLALLLERRFKHLGDHVLTAVQLSSPERAAAFHPEMVAETRQAAVHAIAGVHPRELFNRGPLVRAVTAAVALAGSIVLFALLSTDLFQFWMQRIALSDEPWPRRVQLEVVGFPADADGRRVQKLAQDDDFELLVQARTDRFVAPREVEIRYRLTDGRRGRDTMIRVGEAQPGRDEFQLYRYEFKRVAGDMTFDVVGGDDRVRDLAIQVVERPQLLAIELACVYPEYLGREPRRLTVTGGMRIPEGAQLTLHATASKPLTELRIRTTTDKDDVLQFSAEDADESTISGEQPATSPNSFQWEYGPLFRDDALILEMTDADGVAAREPYRVSLAVVPDELPQIIVRLSGIGSAITPGAVLPLVGRITDDYGLDAAWFEYQVGDGEVHQWPLSIQPDGDLSLAEFDAFDTREVGSQTGERGLGLRPGQRLRLSLHASDRYDLAAVRRVGDSQAFVLDVVTEAQLMALLERQELSLRQRFEAIYEKVTDTRNLLARVDFEYPQAADSADTEATDEPPAATPDRTLARRRLRVAGSLQNVNQSAAEVLDVAEGFDDIHLQLENNRIDNVDLKSRLREQIALPLRRIGENRLPLLAARVQLVEEHVQDAEAGPVALADSLALADEILVEMHAVLERMLELETYHELLALLRGIMTDQEELNRRTRDRQTDRLQSLFEE